MRGYLVYSEARHAYLERNGYDGSLAWLAGVAFPEHATVFTKAQALQLAAQYPADAPVRIEPDPLRREPMIDAPAQEKAS